ncbi:hypothetical protein QNL75_27110 [Pseudomonas amygdali pv. morsprunorum]|uniref:hypothetical protein n=1 Tax=Pseudomonas amygdali TaxID=47877 RepID=UPI00288DA62A|nr:hypothetical protein [Pseudomonas amygdali]MDT3268729.1 hypothetical protein [Pseudomonas amygdali pv. morsprunorum]
MNFKDVTTGEGYSKHSRRNLVLNALIEFERTYAIHRMLPQAVFERFYLTEHEFCQSIEFIARRLLPEASEGPVESECFAEPVTIYEINHILRTPLFEVMSLPPFEGVTR